ncbi:MAG: hypothetical protein AVO38_15665 [delta proteobacterium ML8_D]|jgi:hypothetical protein|nr:MAG: hypothetical protein AVO38_15665 [delta proteobacterium ML8_D]
MGEVKETTNEIILEAYNKFVSDGKISNFEYDEYQPTNANNHIQLRWRDANMPRSIHYEFLFEKQHGGYSVELHAERIKIMKEMADAFKKIKSIVKQINSRTLIFYSRHRDDYGDAIKISYGSDVSPEVPEIMAKDMRALIEETRLLVEEAVQVIEL